MWVVDVADQKIYAYAMDTKARVPGRDFNNLHRVNEAGEYPDAEPHGIWSDGDIMWVLDDDDHAIYAYDMDTKARIRDENFKGLTAVGNNTPTDIWADETTMFVANAFAPNRIYAYWRSTKAPNTPRYIELAASNDQVRGIWSDGSTMWVSDSDDAKIYAYELPEPVLPEDTLSMERVTDTMAMVKVDVQALVRQFGSEEPAVSVKVLGTLSGATMYVHPDGGYARFLLLGLRPETQYTVIASYGVETRYPLGDAGRKVFRTDYARLAGIETSGLTHTEATVTVSLAGADVDGRCCFRWYPHSNEAEAEPGYTYYLRHKASDDTVWSDPVELTFSDFTAEARLTGLVGGVEYSIVELRVGAGGFVPPNEQGKLFLTFDKALPEGAGFTLTVGTTEFNSSDATVSERTYNWGGGPSLSNNASVSVELDFTMVAFREGTTLEEVGAFTTPTMPPTLAFEAEMTVGTTTALDGYHAGQESLSPGNTFDVGGVQYTVESVGYLNNSSEFELSVKPALPFDSFTLTLGATQLQSSSASVIVHSGGTTDYQWSATDPNWANGDPVDVKLDIPLIDICGRSQAVADAIVAATLSYDFCHMISQLDMDDITELDLTGKSGYSLSGHSWNQLPARLFDGLDSLEILRIANAGYLGRGINFADEDIFRGLDTLLELDVRPSSDPPGDVLVPLIMLETLNGEDYTP